MTFGEDWSAVKDVATKSMRPVAKPAESCARMASAAAGSGATGTRSAEGFSSTGRSRKLGLQPLSRAGRELDEAGSIEPVQRNKTITRAMAYCGMRDSVIA